ncbi:uncharacterized protein LOC114801150 isoform X2 [Denticeps clupeoides]|uniref:uncharacterized protein LOC114801150 isoform X2 n=1 Tax=Denticeps clupeoides TaxID=299321 RepID=UPI0010A58B86|nr:uncharacterized protein LOC114801150 isoform X2 [Denticeps clupeoides]
MSRRKHETHLEEYCQLTSTACKRPSEGGTGFKAKQLKLLEAKQVSQKTVDRTIFRFIVQGLQSSLVEPPSFQDLIAELQPSSAVMSRTTVRRKIDSATSKMKERLMNEMKTVPYIDTTTDCWTARRRSFIGVTAHWLDPCSFERRSAALACRQLRGSHTFDALAAVLTDIHAEYEISLKVVRTTTDNGSNFVKAFRVFGQQEENEELVAEGTNKEEVGEDCDASDVEEEVEFMDVEAILEEDDGLQYQLPKHHRYREYVTTMSPVAKSLNILQGEVNIQMGWLLPTITTLTTKLEKSRPSIRFCKPLVDALLEGLRKVARFKISWTSNDTVLQFGLSYIKEHLPEHDEGLWSPDTTSTSSDEDDFFSNVMQTHSH